MNTSHAPAHHLLAGAVSRRTTARGIVGAVIATALGVAAPSHAVAAEATCSGPRIEPDAGSWKPWLLTSGDQLRPPAPGAASTVELAEVAAYAAGRDAAALDQVAYWDAGAPGYRWNEVAMQQTLAAGYAPGAAYRVMALLNAAIYDATIAAWDAKYTYNRPRPAAADPSLQTAVPTPASPSYPCEHAVTAGAAATILAHLFPNEAAIFGELAESAAASRVKAGVAYPGDSATGLDLGRSVGELFVAHARDDGSDAVFDPSTAPSGPGIWTGDPTDPMVGTWQTWILASGDQFRPGPPPAPDSPERMAEIAEVKSYQRDAYPFTELFFWPQDPAGRPAPDSGPFSSNQIVFYYAPLMHFVWGPELAQKLFEYRLDSNPPRAARAYALVSIAGFDATVASSDAKYHYWTARPDQFDPEITTIVPTYDLPDYPSGHATTLAATAEVLSYLFPRDAHLFQSRAEENAASRLWAGIHFRGACDAGLQLGRDVGQAVIVWAATDGAA